MPGYNYSTLHQHQGATTPATIGIHDHWIRSPFHRLVTALPHEPVIPPHFRRIHFIRSEFYQEYYYYEGILIATRRTRLGRNIKVAPAKVFLDLSDESHLLLLKRLAPLAQCLPTKLEVKLDLITHLTQPELRRTVWFKRSGKENHVSDTMDVWGSRASSQLCSYDKGRERKLKLPYNIIRLEIRMKVTKGDFTVADLLAEEKPQKVREAMNRLKLLDIHADIPEVYEGMRYDVRSIRHHGATKAWKHLLKREDRPLSQYMRSKLYSALPLLCDLETPYADALAWYSQTYGYILTDGIRMTHEAARDNDEVLREHWH